jgi:hypothetical protein
MADGCHSLPYDPAIHPCVYGDRRGTTRIALFGDSHALQWLPALARSGERWGWRIVTLTKSACPSAHVVFQQPVFTHATPSCRAWRASGLRWLAAHPQDLVIFSNSHGYRVLNARGQRVRGTAKERVWERGLVAAIRDLPRSQRVLVLGDTPGNHADPPACLARHLTRISACVTGRRKALRASHDRTERSAASTTGATFASLSRQICPYDPCPVIVNELLIWRDRSHLTATYSRQLAPSMVALIRKVLAR